MNEEHYHHLAFRTPADERTLLLEESLVERPHAKLYLQVAAAIIASDSRQQLPKRVVLTRFWEVLRKLPSAISPFHFSLEEVRILLSRYKGDGEDSGLFLDYNPRFPGYDHVENHCWMRAKREYCAYLDKVACDSTDPDRSTIARDGLRRARLSVNGGELF